MPAPLLPRPRPWLTPPQRLFAAAAVSLFLHGLLVLSGGTPGGAPQFSGTAEREDELRKTWLKARLAPPPVPKLLPGAPVRPALPPPVARAEPPAPLPEPQEPLEPARPPAPAGEEGFGILPVPLPQTEEPVYFAASELEERAVPITPIQPYPEVAARGVVTIRLEVFISAAGIVDKVEVISVSPGGFPTGFAERAFKNARFDPARIGGEVVASKKIIELTYTSE